ncbi:MAG: GNAT family N-acetyltransferase [Hyphomicrobiales bacterium]|nr:GNAT family N-acetyltransferase [Hyphomicrobiales bacterium]
MFGGIAVPGIVKRASRIGSKGIVRKFVPLARNNDFRPRFMPMRFLPFRRRTEPIILGTLGAMEVRIARTTSEIRKAQNLRYHVFYEEMSAIPDVTAMTLRRDIDEYDAICDHLLVIDHDAPATGIARRMPKVVGTYRLLRQEVAELNSGFYTAGEFDIGSLTARKPDLNFLELGRSCVLKPYRDKRTIDLMWQGIWSYLQMYNIDVMVGCASLEGTDPDRLALPLSYLHHHIGCPPEWSVQALPERYVAMDRMAKTAISPKEALRALPPLVKGYLRLGAHIGDGAVVDHQFGTTDVLIILPVSNLSRRYVNHYINGARAAQPPTS